jgi:uncharacterized membrane protein YozB (DUF420 family)
MKRFRMLLVGIFALALGIPTLRGADGPNASIITVLGWFVIACGAIMLILGIVNVLRRDNT